MTPRETLLFNLNARIAVRHLEQRHSGGLRWQHEAQRDELLLQGPLGITVARIVSDVHSASLQQGGKTYQAQDVETLMESVLGWGLPLPILHHWLLAEADDSLPAEVERDALGRVTLLRQAGWEARYSRYADDQPDSLPTRISLSRAELQVQLLIDEWEWNPQ
jgi:outer membrane lipoprotein LolB